MKSEKKTKLSESIGNAGELLMLFYILGKDTPMLKVLTKLRA